MDSPPGKLLVVDDNEMNRDLLSRRLARKGYEVEVAEDGGQALEMVEGGTFDLVLLDIMMPGIDGYEVLERVRRDLDRTELPIIMATAKEESEDIVEALKLGANDYVTKPLDFPVVLARVETQLALKRSRDALVAAHARMKSDLEAAARFQRALLPDTLPAGETIEFAFRYLPCAELGGDALNVFAIDDRHLCLYLLDISGHGVPASLMSVTVTHNLTLVRDPSSLVTHPTDEPPGYGIADPADVASRLNALYPMAANDNHYFTLVFCTLDLLERRLHLVNAGHPGPIHVRRDGTAEIVESPNFPVGMLPEVAYKGLTIELAPGDRVYLYCDGFVEAMNQDEEEFGKERLTAVAQSAAHRSLDESVEEMVAAVTAWCGTSEFEDDLSILALQVTG